MDIALSVLALGLSILGIVGAIFPFPGILFSYLGLVCTYFCDYSPLTTKTLIIWAIVSVIVSVIDFILPPFFTKKLGGSKSGVWGATIGMVAGAIFFPPLGVVLGPVFGAVLGELINDRTDTEKAFKIGVASFVSFIFGTGIKLIATVWMFALFVQGVVDYITQFIG